VKIPLTILAALIIVLAGVRFTARLHNQVTDVSTEQRLLAALEKFEPETGKAARAAESDEPAMTKILQVATKHAVLRASDLEVLSFSRKWYTQVERQSDINLPFCVQALAGGSPVSTTEEENRITSEALIHLFESAAKTATPIAHLDAGRAAELLGKIWSEVDPGDARHDAAAFKALPDKQKCDMALAYMRKVNALPRADAALAIRYNMSLR